MATPLKRTNLMVHLGQLDEPVMYGSLLEVRTQLEAWLGYVPQTFPHYTRHTVGHSDEIVRQLSSLLYDGSAQRPVIDLSAAEIYCLVASAYLHDAGMVASDRERLEIMDSQDWKEWTSAGPGERRWREIQALIDQDSEDPEMRRRFAIDLQIRFLLADYVRRQHHTRAGQLIRLGKTFSTTFSLADPAIGRTIADICEGHGLSWQELADTERYPFRRDLPGGTVDVRLMTILLRLGDLLDMSSDRACPMLLAAAAPLPSDSIAHWSQYQRITHRMTAPDRIEITAECETQAEHRVVHDWCQWIADEVANSSLLLHGSPRNPAWTSPLAELTGPSPTLIIRPTASATYVPVDWTFHLDHETVLQRLIVDAYSDRLDFVRELIQNAADASRCEIQRRAGTQASTSRWPDPAQAAEFGIEISLTESTRMASSSGEEEKFSVITVKDHGIGMDAHVIQNYLLQVGVSFYTSAQFRREYGFIPASRFGIGFLSVFAVSDHIVVETYKPSAPDAVPLRLTLTGPRNYILLDRGTQDETGTTVWVALRELVDAEHLKRLIRGWCRMLEFPVTVTSAGETVTYNHEQPDEFELQCGIDAGEYDSYCIRAIPINTPKIRGHWYISETREASTGNVRWDVSTYRLQELMQERSLWAARLPRRVDPLLSLHGITVFPRGGHGTVPISLRLDYRTSQDELPISLNRQSWSTGRFPPDNDDLFDAMLRILVDHFDEVNADWRYRQMVASTISSPWSVTLRIPDLVRVMAKSEEWQTITLEDMANVKDLIFLPSPYEPTTGRPRIEPGKTGSSREQQAREVAAAGDLLILEEDILLDGILRGGTAENSRIPSAVHVLKDQTFAVTLTQSRRKTGAESVFLNKAPGAPANIFAVRLHSNDTAYGSTWVNTENIAFRWLSKIFETEPADGTVISINMLARPTLAAADDDRLRHTLNILLSTTPGYYAFSSGSVKAELKRIIREIAGLAGDEKSTPPIKSFEWQGPYLLTIPR